MDKIDISPLSTRIDDIINASIDFGLKLLFALVILVVGLWLTNRITKSFRKILVARKTDPSILGFLTSLTNIALKILVIITVLTTVGVEMTSIIAILGAASLAIGMALSGTLQNFAGGVVILLFRPFRVNDFIETQSGYSGTVQDILIFTTRIKTTDNRIVYLPNGSLANGVITNFNQEGKRRVDCTYSISYGDDVNKAKEVLFDMLNDDTRVHVSPAPEIFLTSLGDNSVNILVRFWANSSDVFPIQFDLNERVYTEFEKHGLNFPFPQIDVHLDNKIIKENEK